MRKTHICVLTIAALSVAAGAQDASATSVETTAAAGGTTAQTPVVEVIECNEIDSADVIIGNSAIELIYTTPEGKIKVFNDYEVDAVYADSDFDLEREIRLDFFQPSDRITDCCKSGDE